LFVKFDILFHMPRPKGSGNKTPVVKLMVRIPKDLYEKLLKESKDNFRSINMQIIYIINKYYSGSSEK
jgi:hypothetical protein